MASMRRFCSAPPFVLVRFSRLCWRDRLEIAPHPEACPDPYQDEGEDKP